jgi:hypothetical protein
MRVRMAPDITRRNPVSEGFEDLRSVGDRRRRDTHVNARGSSRARIGNRAMRPQRRTRQSEPLGLRVVGAGPAPVQPSQALSHRARRLRTPGSWDGRRPAATGSRGTWSDQSPRHLEVAAVLEHHGQLGTQGRNTMTCAAPFRPIPAPRPSARYRRRALRQTPRADRARLRPHQVQPPHRPLPTTRPSRLQMRMAPHHRHPQPPQAPQAPPRDHSRLTRPTAQTVPASPTTRHMSRAGLDGDSETRMLSWRKEILPSYVPTEEVPR